MSLRDSIPTASAGPGVVRAITKSNITDLPDGICRALWCGTAGTMSFIDEFGTTIENFPAKEGLIPIRVQRVLNAGTASDLWAIY